MSIWAFNVPTDDYDQVVFNFISESLHNGISRFGWSYFDTADLTILQNKPWQGMTPDEQRCWSKASFLLEIKKGDWIVHINIPEWGYCTAARVTGEYSFETEDNDMNDYRHKILIDPKTIIEFNRNDENVIPIISNKLKLRGRYWRIYDETEFYQTIRNLSERITIVNESETIGLHYLKKDINPELKEISNKIQKTHPRDNLEKLIADVFRKIPNVIEVVENGKGKGWGTDFGADLLVKYRAGLSVANLEKTELLVVQVKSYIGAHWETNAVDQIETAIQEFDANAGLIVTTADSTTNLEQAIEILSNKINKPIALISGEDVAKFVLKHGSELIFDV